MGGGGDARKEIPIEETATWVVALVCSIIVIISLAVERILHYTGKYLKRKKQNPLFEALQKIKEELMLLGFISFLLVVFQDRITKLCVSPDIHDHFLPCKKRDAPTETSLGRHLLGASNGSEYCSEKDKVPLMSLEALHKLHIFIFVLAVVHIVFSALTIFFGGARVREWKHWEDSIAKDKYDIKKGMHVQQNAFIKGRFWGIRKESTLLGWLQSVFKQFYGSVTEYDYITLRLGFIMTHCRTNPKFDFHNYMIRSLEADFKKVVGIRWYLWIFVVIFLLVNVNGWNAYFWISFVPFILLLAVGAKLEHVITQLAHDVAEKHEVVEGDLVVRPSDDHFWFHRPRIVLRLIHFILFQNAFEMAYFFWILLQFGFHSCIMGKVGYVVPRLVIGVFIQVLCSYSTLPLYALVAQMGSSFNKAIFDEQVQARLVGWLQDVREKRESTADVGSKEGTSTGIELEKVERTRSTDHLLIGVGTRSVL